MICARCEHPIPPSLIKIYEGFFSQKEVPNVYDWKCPECGVEYKIKSINGEQSIINIKTPKIYDVKCESDKEFMERNGLSIKGIFGI